MRCGALLAALSAVASLGQLPEEMQRKFDEAERRIVRLRPAAFPALPAAVVQELQRRGCTIPQESYTKKLHNGISRILVFWNGSAQNPASLAPMADRNYLQTITSTDPGHSRGLTSVGKAFIMRHYDAYGGPKPPPITHHGIDDAFIEKASVTWYFQGGKWLRLTGAD